ncbi:MAG: hypothetical protein KJO34_09360 [Deltaproteobacteria bacterium]|nr:hypothetical protein [Deltaproteobacteria bacterium]
MMRRYGNAIRDRDKLVVIVLRISSMPKVETIDGLVAEDITWADQAGRDKLADQSLVALLRHIDRARFPNNQSIFWKRSRKAKCLLFISERHSQEMPVRMSRF